MKTGVHLTRGSISILSWILLCYDIKATCEKIEIGAHHALSNKKKKKKNLPFLNSNIDSISGGNCTYLGHKKNPFLCIFSEFIIIRNYITNAAADLGVSECTKEK